MRIKKHRNKNEYVASSVGGIWVRNMYKENIRPIDINNITSKEDYEIFTENEVSVKRSKLPWFHSDLKVHENIVIVSDGMDFDTKHEVLANLPPRNVSIIAVNGALSGWKLIANLSPSGNQRRIDYYVVNNPYKECLRFIPTKHRYYPHCIASTRTNKNFIKEYLGNKYIYQPVCNLEYTGVFGSNSQSIDDYRNPICAAIGLASKFKVKKLLLMCCDDTMKEHRPAAEKTHDGYWRYPQQAKSESIIDANLYWLKKTNAEIGYHSSGSKYKNASYIDLEGILNFFE